MLTIKLGVQYSRIYPTPLALNVLLKDALRYFSKQANEYNKAFTSGRWDGFVKMYDSVECKFPTGLLPRVKRILQENNYEFTIVNDLPPLPDAHTWNYQPEHELRDYQELAVAQALRWRRGLVAIPTGGGKTEVAQAIIARSQVPRVVFYVPSKTLLRQTVKRFQRVFPDATVLQWGDGVKPPAAVPDSYILVSTVQSAHKNPSELIRQASMVIVDEAHHQAASTFQQATVAAERARYLIGLSATPYRSDNADMELEGWLGPVVSRISYDELLSKRYLVPPEFHSVTTLEQGLELTRGKRTLIFSEKWEDLEKHQATFAKHGVVLLNGKMGKAIPKALEDIEAGRITHIAATPLFDEGLDIGGIEAVFFFACNGVKGRAVQRIGRAMRNGKCLDGSQKTHCMVVDLRDKKYHERKKGYLEEPAFRARIRV